MCGIAGYSLSFDSNVDRTLAAQALLAGIADRGADAVGYAFRPNGDGYSTVVKQRFVQCAMGPPVREAFGMRYGKGPDAAAAHDVRAACGAA